MTTVEVGTGSAIRPFNEQPQPPCFHLWTFVSPTRLEKYGSVKASGYLKWQKMILDDFTIFIANLTHF
jgi:hypothetical protein